MVGNWMSHTANNLSIPPDAISDPHSVEMVRAWIANSALHCCLQVGVWSDKPGAWGILLADIARHVANAMEEEQGAEVSETIATIRKAFDAEMDSPTDEPTGGFVE
jgi:hypothetical protein